MEIASLPPTRVLRPDDPGIWGNGRHAFRLGAFQPRRVPSRRTALAIRFTDSKIADFGNHGEEVLRCFAVARIASKRGGVRTQTGSDLLASAWMDFRDGQNTPTARGAPNGLLHSP